MPTRIEKEIEKLERQLKIIDNQIDDHLAHVKELKDIRHTIFHAMRTSIRLQKRRANESGD